MRACSGLLGTVLILAAASGEASSGESTRQPIPLGEAGFGTFGVALSGRSVVWPWAEGRFASPVEIRIASAERGQRTILRGEVTPGDAVEQLPFFDAGPRQVAASLVDFVRTESTVHVVGASMWAGPPRGPLERLDEFGPRKVVVGVAVSGQRIALLVRRRNRERARLVIRNTATGKDRITRLSRHTPPMLAMAGRFVATAKQRGNPDLTRIVVRNFRTQRVVTRTRVHADPLDLDFALRRDGTLAIASRFWRFRASLVKPGARPKRLPVRPVREAIRFGGRGVVYARRSGRGPRLVEVTDSGRVRPLTAPIPGLVSFDASARRLALRTRRCVYVARIPALGPAPPCAT